MNDEPTTQRGELPLDVLNRIDSLCDAYEQALARGERPDVGAYLDQIDPAFRSHLQREMGRIATGVHSNRPSMTEADRTLERAVGNAATVTREVSQAAEGKRIAGRYTLEQKLGEGGMGEVWVAKQSEPVKRRVAMKLIKAGMDSRAVLQRFEQERQALALMDHPNIARVLDGGLTAEGRPYFVMELVNGLPLTKFCDEARLNPRDRLELFVPICQAVQHAHQKGVVHRDLKPANILVTLVDGRPVPKVIDFGVAKATAGRLTDESLSTQFGAVLGTLEYMSPEQAGFAGEDIDTRADIYSLGVILYELLTGLRPIDAARLKQAALTEMIRIIREEEPSKPSTRLSTSESLPSVAAVRQTDPRRLTKMLRGELDWVVMKCLEKPRDRRYETANALARDIQRYLADEPVEARPPSAGYRFRKFVRRNKGQVIAAILVLLTLVAGIVGTTYGLIRANAARRAEGLQRKRAEAREQMAIDAVKRFRDVVSDNPELQDNEALESLRMTLLKEPLRFFRLLREQLSADGDTRPETMRRLAGAAFDLGLLTYESGDLQDAKEAFAQARMLYEQLLTSSPKDVNLRRLLAQVLHEEGGLQFRTGAHSDGLRTLERAIQTREELHDEGADARDAIDLAKSLSNAGVYRSELHQSEQSEAAFRNGIAICQKILAARPGDLECAEILSKSYGGLAELQIRLAKPEQAQGLLRDEIRVLDQLSPKDRAKRRFRDQMASALIDLSVANAQTGRPGEARRALERSVELLEKLVAEHPTNTECLVKLGTALSNLGYVHSFMKENAKAETYLSRSIKIRTRLININPRVHRYRHDLASSYLNLGIAQMGQFQFDNARVSFVHGQELFSELAKKYPDVPEYSSSLARSFHCLAGVEVFTENWEKAREHLRNAILCNQKLLRREPNNEEYKADLRNNVKELIKVAKELTDGATAAWAEQLIREAETKDPRLAALDARLRIVQAGHAPADNTELLILAQHSYDTSRFALAARMYGQALTSDGTLADDRRVQHRYNGACAAALAGCGQGIDDPAPTEAEKSTLRQQALDWLRAELDVWSKLLETATPEQRQAIAQTLNHWRNVDSDLAGIRDESQLAKLPDVERASFRQFWSRVEALRAKAAGESGIPANPFAR